MTDLVTDQPVTVEERPGALALTFIRPIIGFGDACAYELRNLEAEYAPYRMLASLDVNGLEFICVPPGALFSDYVIEIADADTEALDLQSAEDVEVLVLVTAGAGTTPTVNLLGPVVINRRTGRAAQIVLADDQYGVAVPVTAPSATY